MYTLQVRSILGTGKRERAAPLAGPGFGGDLLDAENLVVVSLGHGRVGLVAARGAHAFVFKIDFGRGAQGLLKGRGPGQWGRPPDGEHVQHRFGDIDPAIRTDLLFDQIHGKYRRQHIRADGLSIGTQRGVHLDVGQDIVPFSRDFIFGQDNALRFHLHSSLVETSSALAGHHGSNWPERSKNDARRIGNRFYAGTSVSVNRNASPGCSVLKVFC
jgi:hypothetical protein